MPSDIPNKALVAMVDQTKLLLTLEGLTAAEAERVRVVMNRRFAQFRFDCALEGMSSTSTGHDLLARGPWHLSARERPAMDAMRTFAEGAAAMCRLASQLDEHGSWIEARLAREEP